MRTGLVRYYGEKNTVEEYIDVAIRHFRRSERVRDTAIKYYYYIAQQPTPINDLYKSMLAMTVVFLAAKEHAKDIKKVLDESGRFPNLKRGM